MISTILACFIKRTSIASSSSYDQLKVSEAVYRDDLIIVKKPPHLPVRPSPCKAVVVKKSVRFADSEPAILGGAECDDEKKDLVKGISCGGGNKINYKTAAAAGGEEKGGIRVKLKMTKEEAARLLSKCKNGGQLDFKDVARELVALPINRVSVVSTYTNK